MSDMIPVKDVLPPEKPYWYLLNNDEIEFWTRVKRWMPGYYIALVAMAQVIADRNKKYAGENETERDIFGNFVLMARQLGKNLREVFAFYRAIKTTRLAVNAEKSYADESVFDTRRDELNYQIIELGAELLRRDTKKLNPELKPWKDEKLIFNPLLRLLTTQGSEEADELEAKYK